jgi:hypothetical protein
MHQVQAISCSLLDVSLSSNFWHLHLKVLQLPRLLNMQLNPIFEHWMYKKDCMDLHLDYKAWTISSNFQILKWVDNNHCLIWA